MEISGDSYSVSPERIFQLGTSGYHDAAVLGLPCPGSRLHLGRDRALQTSPEVGRCGTSRYVFTLDVSVNEVQPSVGDFVFVMGWFTTLDRCRR